jgi:hypothetical protein
MASTTFIDGTTPILAAWLNDVNNAVYNGIFLVPPSFINLTLTGTLTVGGLSTLGAMTSTGINNSPIGATTASTGKFTTLQVTPPANTGAIGIGTAASAWGTGGNNSIDFGTLGSINSGGNLQITTNAYYNGTNWIYKTTNYATQIQQMGASGVLNFLVAPSGTAGNTVTFVTALSIANAGNITVSAPTSGDALVVNSVSGAAALSAYGHGTAVGVVYSQAGTGAAFYADSSDSQGSLLISPAAGAGAYSSFLKVNSTGLQIGHNSASRTLDLLTNNLVRVSTNGAGNVTVNAPASGVGLTVNGFSGSNVTNFLGNQASSISVAISNTNAAGGSQLLLYANNTAVQGFAEINTSGAMNLGVGGSNPVNLYTNGVQRLQVTGAGNVTISAPTSGVALTVNAVSGTHSTQIGDSANTKYNAGFLEAPVNNQATPYTAVLADSGKCLYYSATGAAAYTIPANASVAYPVGTVLTFVNDATGATNMTIAITTDTLVLSPGGTTGSRTLAQYGRATAHKVTTTRWIISGSGLT